MLVWSIKFKYLLKKCTGSFQHYSESKSSNINIIHNMAILKRKLSRKTKELETLNRGLKKQQVLRYEHESEPSRPLGNYDRRTDG